MLGSWYDARPSSPTPTRFAVELPDLVAESREGQLRADAGGRAGLVQSWEAGGPPGRRVGAFELQEVLGAGKDLGPIIATATCRVSHPGGRQRQAAADV